MDSNTINGVKCEVNQLQLQVKDLKEQVENESQKTGDIININNTTAVPCRLARLKGTWLVMEQQSQSPN